MASQHAAPAALEVLQLRDVVDAVLSKLDGVSLARSCCVCKLWNEAARLDRLWLTAYESAAQDAFQRNTQTQLPALLQAAGGWRGLYVWYRRTVLSPKGRVWIDNGQGGAHVPISIAGFGDVTVGSIEVCGPQGEQMAASQQNFTWSPNGALVAHTLVYRSTAGILGSSIASAVMIVDVTTGRRVRVDLEVPYPPFFFHWSPCGTRLAMLSNWHHMQVALRIMEVPLAAFASPAPLQDSPPPKVVLASLGRPLFISWHPDASIIVQAVDGERCSFLDIDWALEQNKGREIAPETEAPGPGLPQQFVQSLKAPLWLQDAEERHWLLLPETVTEWPGVEAMQGQVVLLAPFNPHVQSSDSEDDEDERRASRYEAMVSRPVLPKCTLGTFSTTQADVAFAATRDASAIAWLTGRHEVFTVLRLPGDTADGLPAYSPPRRVWPADGIFKTMSRDDVIGRPPIAMQWSPSGRRLLMLLMSAAYGGPQGVQMVQWVVWDLLANGTLSYTICEKHHAPQEFVQSQASFFDSYAQAGTLWAPTSDAFCYSALPQGDEDHMQSDFNIYVQPVPKPVIRQEDNIHLPVEQLSGAAIVPGGAPPVRIAPGRSANWSPR